MKSPGRWFHLIFTILILCNIFEFIFSMRLPDPPVFDKVAHYPSVCYLPPDSGMCPSSDTLQQSDDDTAQSNEKLDVRYYFDITTTECYPFGVQNCGGNENRFKTLNDCQETCRMK